MGKQHKVKSWRHQKATDPLNYALSLTNMTEMKLGSHNNTPSHHTPYILMNLTHTVHTVASLLFKDHHCPSHRRVGLL